MLRYTIGIVLRQHTQILQHGSIKTPHINIVGKIRLRKLLVHSVFPETLALRIKTIPALTAIIAATSRALPALRITATTAARTTAAVARVRTCIFCH
ncbi:hypothetical protein [Corynebacterium lipophiloflavum]|uniref:hypothetical protein n=1 Tax=Corynebacterium lipophiloflavum TaxID=161889 RepID=UPI001FE09D33|nr:hypothetical protein [Corynebacterium lipophiloflavum]